jgi:hypothetical protein
MPIVGPNFGGKFEIGRFRTPKKYIAGSRRGYHPGPQGREQNY